MNALLKSVPNEPAPIPVAVSDPARTATPRKPAASTAAARRVQPFAAVVRRVAPPLTGIALVLLVWQVIAAQNEAFPSPLVTWQAALELFADPFYRNSPNDQGIGWNVLASLQRVAIGFGLAALIGIPLGFVIGRVQFVSRMFGPIISLLKPVSPLAWLPIGLLVFKSADPAAIWSIFICSIWPMIINTAVGLSSPATRFSNVDLPQPEWPISVMNSPLLTVRSIPCNAGNTPFFV